MLFKDNKMKHELRRFLERGFQSYDDLKGLSERLKTSAAAIEVMLALYSHNDVNLAGVNKSAANLILSALFQGKPYESGEYKPQKSIGWPFDRSKLLLERTNGLGDVYTLLKELESPCKMPKTKEITLDLSQPIKEIERLNKKLGKTIDKMSQIPPELLSTGMNYRTYEHTDGKKYAFPEIKADEVKKELEKRETEIKVLEEIKCKSKEMHQATNPEEGPIKVPEILRDLAEGQNKIATILQKRLQNGNI